jgi:hypothetical protein
MCQPDENAGRPRQADERAALGVEALAGAARAVDRWKSTGVDDSSSTPPVRIEIPRRASLARIVMFDACESSGIFQRSAVT